MRQTSAVVRRRIREMGDPGRAEFAQRYFKTGPGEYAEGDRFIGLNAQQARALGREFRELPIGEAAKLLRSPLHEDRAIALLILCERFRRHEDERKAIFDLYLASTRWINNWDLVDLSAEHIVGAQLFPRGGAVLTRLARSKLLWDRRIAMMATFHFVRRGKFRETLRIARLLLNDREDLIHKATGWMLREVGKRDIGIERQFLDQFAARMPRTMLRYAIERFPEPSRRQYLAIKKD